MKVYTNRNQLNLVFVEYDLLNSCIKCDSGVGVVCVTSGMDKMELATQLRNVADQITIKSGDIFILQ